MAERSTGAQREYALSLGCKFTDDTSLSEMSALIDKAKTRMDKPVNGVQKRTAKAWGIDLSGAATQRDACDELMTFTKARRWVYSVARRQAAINWRFYHQSGLCDQAMNQIARWFLGQPGYLDQVTHIAVGDAKTTDVWFRLTDRECSNLEPYLATAQKLYETFGNNFSQPKPVGKQSTDQQVQRKGCFGILVSLAVIIGGMIYVILR